MERDDLDRNPFRQRRASNSNNSFDNALFPDPNLHLPWNTRAPGLSPYQCAEQEVLATESSLLEATISRMTEDLERFSSPPPTPKGDEEGSSQVLTTFAPTPEPQRRPRPAHSSMENLHRPKNYRNRTRFTCTQRMREEVQHRDRDRVRDSSTEGEKPNNITDENQMLYQALDRERQQLILRKGICIFMYGALRKQSDRVLQLETRNKGKTEECAARVILHSLLLNSFRKTQAQLNQILGENNQLQKSVRLSYHLVSILMLQYAMYLLLVWIPMLFKNRNRILHIDIKCEMSMSILVNNFIFFPMVHFLLLYVKYCTGKWIKLFTKTVLAFNLHFQHI